MLSADMVVMEPVCVADLSRTALLTAFAGDTTLRKRLTTGSLPSCNTLAGQRPEAL